MGIAVGPDVVGIGDGAGVGASVGSMVNVGAGVGTSLEVGTGVGSKKQYSELSEKTRHESVYTS